jgi:L-fucose mutarotase
LELILLKNIDPVLSPELLKILAEMGHDEALVLVDANFTAMSLGADKPVVRLPGIGMVRAARAIISLLPLEAEIAHPVAFMHVTGKEAGYQSALQREVLAELQGSLLAHQSAEPVERFAFYERVKKVYAIVVTGELQGYANFILRKGVIAEPLRA